MFFCFQYAHKLQFQTFQWFGHTGAVAGTKFCVSVTYDVLEQGFYSMKCHSYSSAEPKSVKSDALLKRLQRQG